MKPQESMSAAEFQARQQKPAAKRKVKAPPPPKTVGQYYRQWQAELDAKMAARARIPGPDGIAPDGSVTVPIKPLSVNQCWQGKRYRSKAYDAYERAVMVLLPAIQLPQPPYHVSYEFGVSNMQADVDNPVKPLQDILSKKYSFNDAHIHAATTRKIKVAKGAEYFTFLITTHG